MLDRASSMTETPRVDVPPPPPGTPPSAESPERPIPVMAPPRKGANLRVLFVVPEVNRHLAAANGYMFSGERRMANYELNAASAAIQASTYPQC